MSSHFNENLAFFGAKPAFEQKLHVGRPNIGSKEQYFELMNEVFDDKWLTNAGPKVQKLEAEIADLLGVKHIIAMCNGTIAMEIAIRAMGITGEAIIPAFTFVACAHAFQWQGIKPVLCDVDLNSHNIDPAKIEALISPQTIAIMGVHLWGNACDIQTIEHIANKHNLISFYDASHAFNCSAMGQKIGNFGKCEIFSFHATKFFNTFEGGAIATNDDDLAAKIRLMKNFGFAGYDKVVYIGTNGKMNEASAAMGLVNLAYIEDFLAKNKENHKLYKQLSSDIDGLTMFDYKPENDNNFHYVIFEWDESKTGISRDRVVELLHSENILARKYFYPGIQNMEPYRSLPDYQNLDLPNTDLLSKRILSFPNGTSISKNEIEKIMKKVNYIAQNGKAISQVFDTINMK